MTYQTIESITFSSLDNADKQFVPGLFPKNVCNYEASE